jgi:hypothetical protein
MMTQQKRDSDSTRKLLQQRLVPTRKLAALLLGVTPPALSLWTKQDWFDPAWKTKVGADDCYNIVAIHKAVAEQGRKGSPQSDLSQQIRTETNQEKRDIIRREREERQIQRDERRGNILPRDEYTFAIRETIIVARDHLMAIPKQLVRLVTGNDDRFGNWVGSSVEPRIGEQWGHCFSRRGVDSERRRTSPVHSRSCESKPSYPLTSSCTARNTIKGHTSAACWESKRPPRFCVMLRRAQLSVIST